ncbi:MAG: ATP-binding protein, partial [Phycisphaerae bacterium]
NWEVEHALREIIANAIDEQLISSTREIEIVRDAKGAWHVRDFGRGLRIEHFTLNENQEKLKSIQGVIGKFGVGLKDALATFHRRGIGVQIRSRFGTFRLKQEHKHGFQNIQTLHVEYDDNGTDFEGTDFVFSGVTDVDVSRAKSLFLRFAGEELLETNPYGQILKRNAASARVYILGVLAAEEPNFLFSYNLTNLTETMKKRLNRERLHVGRTTYADRVRAILKSSAAESVKIALVNEVQNRAIGQSCDEMGWIEISQKALTLMHERRNVAYLTERELHTSPGMLDAAKRDGYQVVVITDHQKAKLTEQAMAGGTQVRTLDAFGQQYNASFDDTFVGLAELTQVERSVFERT